MKIENIENFISEAGERTLLRFSTAGSVDDGKSTLIGRLLLDSKNLFEDTIEAVKNASKDSDSEFDLSYFTDGLISEREQKITIDVAYRFFSSKSRNFILADTPGHEQYTRNMVTGASTADAAIIVVDVSKGVTTQTRRHTFILSLLGIKHILVAVNKMDLVAYSKEAFDKECKVFESFTARMGIADLQFIPVSSLLGDNVVNTSDNMKWYRGKTILQYLEDVYVEGGRNLIDFRMPVQRIVTGEKIGRLIQGQVVSGVVRKGDKIVVLPSMERACIKEVLAYEGARNEAWAGLSTSLVLDREVDVDRGGMLVHENNIPHVVNDIESMVVWMDQSPLDLDKTYLLQHTTRLIKCNVIKHQYKIDINTLHSKEPDNFSINDIGRIAFHAHSSLYIDYYRNNRSTGSFILIDPDSNNTVAAGMIIDRVKVKKMAARGGEYVVQPGLTVWLTGLSGAGKSTLASMTAQRITQLGYNVTELDGDIVRKGICSDLGFSAKDRLENIRRVAEIAKLLNKAGVHVIASFISPTEDIRKMASEIIGEEAFHEVYVNASLHKCEERDVKGLYQEARAGNISNFTGISAPFEPPAQPSLSIDTEKDTVDESVRSLVNYFSKEMKSTKG